MSDFDAEEKISLMEGATYVQRTFGGPRPSPSTMARWCLSGMRGRILESIKRGGPRRTSREAIHRFFRRLAERSERRIDTDAARKATEYLIGEGV